MNLSFLGDVHCKYLPLRYMDFIDEVFQVGDMGLGFDPQYDDLLTQQIKKHNIKFIRGNHDNFSTCKGVKGFIPDGNTLYRDGKSLFFCGGARSVDQEHRKEGVDWWPDEELHYDELTGVIQSYEATKPDIMVTHDCPQDVAQQLCGITGADRSMTRVALQIMFDIHKPKYWVFGHWHQSINKKVRGTQFVCLDELERFTLNLDLI